MSLQGDRLRAWKQAGERMNDLRKKKGITHRTLSGLSGLSVHSTELMAQGKNNMSVVSALALANVLDCTPEFLLFGTGQ